MESKVQFDNHQQKPTYKQILSQFNWFYRGIVALLVILVFLWLALINSHQTPKKFLVHNNSSQSHPTSGATQASQTQQPTAPSPSANGSNTNTSTVTVNGQAVSVPDNSNYSQTINSDGSTVNVSVSHSSSSSGQSTSNQSSSSITVNSNGG